MSRNDGRRMSKQQYKRQENGHGHMLWLDKPMVSVSYGQPLFQAKDGMYCGILQQPPDVHMHEGLQSCGADGTRLGPHISTSGIKESMSISLCLWWHDYSTLRWFFCSSSSPAADMSGSNGLPTFHPFLQENISNQAIQIEINFRILMLDSLRKRITPGPHVWHYLRIFPSLYITLVDRR